MLPSSDEDYLYYEIDDIYHDEFEDQLEKYLSSKSLKNNGISKVILAPNNNNQNININDSSYVISGEKQHINQTECFSNNDDDDDIVIHPSENNVIHLEAIDNNETESDLKNKIIPLTDQQIKFQERFYSIFLHGIKGKNKFKKEYVIKIHAEICSKLGIESAKRIHQRKISTYFQDFEPDSKKILGYLEEHKKELSSLINLSKIKSRKKKMRSKY
ncbi:hypothetical protein M9Y10_024253 [Tritrichomonas musculus]|uniref:Uncharacterized protein n=1 Tax=Tritrichomonas musculus TaxID=1915356 RepID=A0ABR2GLC1_9EUKA